MLLAAKGALESSLVFEPVHGAGEYLLYYLPHTTRWQTFDGRDDLQACGARVRARVGVTG